MRVVLLVGFILAVGVSMVMASCMGSNSPPGTFPYAVYGKLYNFVFLES